MNYKIPVRIISLLMAIILCLASCATAEESFFVDDQPLNIQAAQALGMAGHVFDQNNIDALRKALREVGVQL